MESETIDVADRLDQMADQLMKAVAPIPLGAYDALDLRLAAAEIRRLRGEEAERIDRAKQSLLVALRRTNEVVLEFLKFIAKDARQPVDVEAMLVRLAGLETTKGT